MPVGDIFHQLVGISRPAGFRDRDECGIVMRHEGPFHSCWAAIARPLDADALVWLDDFRHDVDRNIVHLPIPLNRFADFEPSAASGDQNFAVISGSRKASNTSLGGLRMSIAVFATGMSVSRRLSMMLPFEGFAASLSVVRARSGICLNHRCRVSLGKVCVGSNG